MRNKPKHLKETQKARAERLQAEEGGRRHRSKQWSANGETKNVRKNRRDWKKEERNYLT